MNNGAKDWISLSIIKIKGSKLYRSKELKQYKKKDNNVDCVKYSFMFMNKACIILEKCYKNIVEV